MLAGAARIASVNIGTVQSHEWNGRTYRTGYFKQPVDGRVALTAAGLEGDGRAYTRTIGHPDHAVYAYATEDAAWWQDELVRPLPPGSFAENLTVTGVDLVAAEIGQRWRLDDAELEVVKPRIPCKTLALAFRDTGFVKRFAQAGRAGAYLKVVRAGTVGAGDHVEIVDRPGHGVTVGMVFRAMTGDADLAPRLLDCDRLPDDVRAWAERHTAGAR